MPRLSPSAARFLYFGALYQVHDVYFLRGSKSSDDVLSVIVSSSNGSNNTNKETRSSSSADRSASGRFTGADTDDTVTVRLSGRRDDPAVTASTAAGGDAASPGGSGSFDDEWSRQMDELDRLRPVVAFDDDERLVVDSFTDLPDIVVCDDDDVDVKQTNVEQVKYNVLCFLFQVIFICSDCHHRRHASSNRQQ